MAELRPLLLAAALVWTTPAAAQSIADWRPHILEASSRFGVPSAWIEAVMQAESGGRTHIAGRPIRSSAGAIGLMQLMPATWAEMRVRLALGADPDDPRDNILAGTFYLRLMYERFGYPGLFAAYNAGPRRYAEHLAGRRALPGETVRYLARVTPAATVVRPAAIAAAPVTIFAIRKDAQPKGDDTSPPVPSPMFVPLSRQP